MPTEAFGIETTTGASHGVFTVSLPAYLLNEVKDFLVAAGWGYSQESQSQGTYDIDFPYGAQITTEPDPLPAKVDVYDRSEMVLYAAYDPDNPSTREDYVRFCLYDPYRENPIANPEIVWVEMGLTIAETLDNLSGAIVGNTYLELGAAGVYQQPPSYPGEQYWVIPLVATDGGTFSAPTGAGGSTYLRGSPSGYWTTVSYTGGAGWYLTTSHLSASLKLWLLVDVTYPAALFRAQINDALAVDYNLWRTVADPASVEWEIVGSAKQFFLWTEEDPLDSYMVSLPYVFPDRGITRAGILNFGLGWRDTLLWSSGWGRLAINSGWVEVTSPVAPDRQSGLCYSYNRGPFVYAAGETLIENALFMAPRADLASSETARIIGKFWNAFIMRRNATPGEQIFYDEEPYICVAREAGTSRPVGSLWIRKG